MKKLEEYIKIYKIRLDRTRHLAHLTIHDHGTCEQLVEQSSRIKMVLFKPFSISANDLSIHYLYLTKSIYPLLDSVFYTMSYIHKSIETGDVDEFNELLIEDLLDTVTDKRERENLGKILTKFNRTDMNRYFLKAVWKFLADHLE